MRSTINLFVVYLTHKPRKEVNAAMLIGYMDIARLLIHVQQVDVDKLKDREVFKNKRLKTSCNEFRKKKSSMNSSFQRKPEGPAPPSFSALVPKIKGEHNGKSLQPFRDRHAKCQGS